MLFNCPKCGQYTPGSEATCPGCGHLLYQERRPRPVQVREAAPNPNLVACPDCGHACSRAAMACPSCGRPLQATGVPAYIPPQPMPPLPYPPPPLYPPKSRAVYVVLALFLGWLGIHNFYAGRNSEGVAQLLITLTLGWLCFIGVAISAIWALVEIITVDTDGHGRRMP